MSKRIEMNGSFFRMRRGKLVLIPKQWLGQIPTEKTIRDRASKQKNKQARAMVKRERKIGGWLPDMYVKKYTCLD